jgi:septum formation protein
MPNQVDYFPMRLILGSQSPQRREILSFYSLPFEQISPNFAEELVPFEGDPILYAQTIALGKAHSLASRYENSIIITADTVVYKENKIFNKPADEAENFAMLKELNGSWHSVFTAVTVQKGKQHHVATAETRVQFHALNDDELRNYHRAFKGSDKAGGYSIQKGGSVIVKRIEGCFYNVVGLPISIVQLLLKEVGINLWDYLSS